MTQQLTKGTPTIVMGAVTHIFPPGEREGKNGKYLAPGKMLLESDKLGSCAISFFQLYNDLGERTENMPELWNTIWSEQDSIKGNRVIVSCKFDSEYLNQNTGLVQHQFNKASSIEFVDFDPTASSPTPSVVPTVAPTTTVSATPPSMSIERHLNGIGKDMSWTGLMTAQKHDIYWAGSINNVSPIRETSAYKEASEEDKEMMIIKEAMPFYRVRIKGPNFEDEPEDEVSNEEILFEEATDLGAGLMGEI